MNLKQPTQPARTQPATQPAAVLSLDIETCSLLVLTKVGVFKYAEHSSTRIICIGYAFDDEPEQLWSALSGEPLPLRIVEHAQSGGQMHAHNAGFEMVLLSSHAGQAIGFPRTKVSQWRDTAAKVAAHGLPRSLNNAALALRGIPLKDEVGKKVMLRLAKPAGLAAATPEQLATLYVYCKNDVAVERAINHVLPDLTAYEQQVWELDYKINKYGLLVDMDLVHKSIALLSKYVEGKVQRCAELTGGIRPSQRAAIIEWCEAQGYTLRGYTADDIKAALAEEYLPPDVREVLAIRQATASAAVKKYAAFALSTCADGRIRGMFLFNGAATGRWTGRGAQLHNLSRPVLLKTVEQLAEAIKRAQNGLYPVDEDKHILTAFKDLVRSVLIAAEGSEFEVSDFSSVEARVLGWIARDPIYQAAFEKDLDLYVVTAAAIYGVAYDKVTDDQRFLGKASVLGLGYAMGLQKFVDTVAKSGKKVPRELIAKAHAGYRATYSAIVKLWSDFGAASILAVQTGVVQRVGRCLVGTKTYHVGTPQEVTFLYTQLPSGRRLAYYMPEVKLTKTPWGEMRPAFTALVLNEKTKQLDRNPVHGGLLAQHACQAIARDLLANGLMKSKHLPIAGHVHDEIIAEKRIDAEQQLPQTMTDLPPWAKGLVIKAHGFTSKRYRK